MRVPRLRLVWSDFAVLFLGYVAGLLAVGLALGGDEARNVAYGSLAGAALGIGSVVVLVLLRAHQHHEPPRRRQLRK